jgi:hypothetical protein
MSNHVPKCLFIFHFSCCTFHGLDPLACANSELTSESMNPFRNFGRTLWTGVVFDFILHTAYTVDACALTSILLSLSLIDMIYCTPNIKVTPASVQGVGVNF